MWIFGYGSLVWRPAFEYKARRPAYITGYMRRFWQASPDHRGTEAAPGRVVTLLPEPRAVCWGMGYEVASARAEEILAALDFREKAGYERREVSLRSTVDGAVFTRALIYIAAPGNPSFIGEHSLEEVAAIARVAHGPSGSNREYVLRLHQALVEMGARDEHVAELARLVAVDEPTSST